MKPSWRPVELTVDCMSGISVKSERNSQLKMQRMGLLNCCSFTEVTQPRYLISPGTPVRPGSSALCLKTTSCKCGRWQRTSTTMRNRMCQPVNWKPRSGLEVQETAPSAGLAGALSPPALLLLLSVHHCIPSLGCDGMSKTADGKRPSFHAETDVHDYRCSPSKNTSSIMSSDAL